MRIRRRPQAQALTPSPLRHPSDPSTAGQQTPLALAGGGRCGGEEQVAPPKCGSRGRALPAGAGQQRGGGTQQPERPGPSMVAQKMYEAKLAVDEAAKSVANLILEHKLLSDKHKLLQAELQNKAGTKDQVDELLKRIADIQAEKKALEDRHKDCTSMSDLVSQLKERDEKHQAELKKEQDEVSRLKAQLEDMKKEYKAEIEKVTASSAQTIAEEKECLEGQAQKYKDLLDNAEAQATSAQKELDVLKGKAHVWLSELTRINSEMAKNFPHSELVADTAASRARLKRAEFGPISDAWEMGDHLASLSARLKLLNIIKVNVLNAAIHTFGALWPGIEPPKSVTELVKWLMTSDDRINEWRESAARVGADLALSFVLSWYEGINLEVLKAMRAGSKWTTDPELIKQRQETAYSFIPYANIDTFVEGPSIPLDDSEESEEEGEEEVDEEIIAETNVPSAGSGDPDAGTAAPSTDPSGSGTVA